MFGFKEIEEHLIFEVIVVVIIVIFDCDAQVFQCLKSGGACQCINVIGICVRDVEVFEPGEVRCLDDCAQLARLNPCGLIADDKCFQIECWLIDEVLESSRADFAAG